MHRYVLSNYVFSYCQRTSNILELQRVPDRHIWAKSVEKLLNNFRLLINSLWGIQYENRISQYQTALFIHHKPWLMKRLLPFHMKKPAVFAYRRTSRDMLQQDHDNKYLISSCVITCVNQKPVCFGLLIVLLNRFDSIRNYRTCWNHFETLLYIKVTVKIFVFI